MRTLSCFFPFRSVLEYSYVEARWESSRPLQEDYFNMLRNLGMVEKHNRVSLTKN